MGWKYPSKLTTAERAMLRRVEQDPFYVPKAKRTRKRYAKLKGLGFIEVLRKKPQKARVNLDPEKEEE